MDESTDSKRRFNPHPQSSPGDFYVVNGECISCGAPHAVAPDLIGWATLEPGETPHCIWKKQPFTHDELEQAISAFEVSEVGCYRYAGADQAIISRIGKDYCDQNPRAQAPEFSSATPASQRVGPALVLTVSQPSRLEKVFEQLITAVRTAWHLLTLPLLA